MRHAPRTRRLVIAAAALTATALALAGCSGSGSGGSSGSALTIGTTDKITSIDPAGSYDNGSFAVMSQVYPFLMTTPYGSPTVKPDIATSAKYTSPTKYTVTLKKGLKFANGHDLTSSDVKFSFDRILEINDPNGPASLLQNLQSVATPNATTAVFTLKVPDDQTFPQVLSSPAGPIVDEQSFSSSKVTPDDTIVKDKAFAGQYQISSYQVNNLIQYTKYDGYKGLNPPAKTDTVNVKYYSSSSNLKLDIQSGNIDVAYRSLTATDIASLETNKKVKVVQGPGGEIRYIVFNLDTMPFGAKAQQPDAAKALAIRKAMADLVDRAAIAKQVYRGTYSPLYSFVPDGLPGATTPLKSLYGDGNGGSSTDKAKQELSAAGVAAPVTLDLQYNTDHYGEGSADEYALIKSQLESSGLFTVNLQSTEYVQYSKQRVNDYPEYQLGWFPDYSDADNYLTPFFGPDSFLQNHYSNDQVTQLLTKEQSESDADARAQTIEQIQQTVAQDLPTLPLLQGKQVAVTGTDVTGTQDTLDASFKFRYAALAKK